jgi:hypothetical protein
MNTRDVKKLLWRFTSQIEGEDDVQLFSGGKVLSTDEKELLIDNFVDGLEVRP